MRDRYLSTGRLLVARDGSAQVVGSENRRGHEGRRGKKIQGTASGTT